MIDVQNRTPLPGKEGRVTLALDDGTTLGGILSMADEATQEGTPWDRDTARKLQADIRTYPVSAGQSITAGDVVDVVGGEVTNYGKISSLPVGSVIQLNENGSPVDYIIVNQGKPSSIYDDSCSGTWVLRKNIFESHKWDNTNVNDWANSFLKKYLDSTFLARFDSATQAKIKQVKIPYRPGSGTSTTVNSGANGLPCKVFLLSGYEIGWTNSDTQYFPADGAKLSYFDSGTGTTANNKRIGYLSGSATYWWLRSPYTGSSADAWLVYHNGDYGGNVCSNSYGVRPALVLSRDVPSQAVALTTAAAGQNCEVIYSGVASLPGITVGQKITSDGVYGVGVLDGVLQVWSKDRPGQVVTGSYIGDGHDVRSIDLGFTPSALLIVTYYGAMFEPTNSYVSGGLVLPGFPLTAEDHADYKAAEIIPLGFKVYYDTTFYRTTNKSGVAYYYIAFK